MKRASLDDVLMWLADSNVPWGVFHKLKMQADADLKRIKAEQERLEYEKRFVEAELAWKTKANTPWEAAMRDKHLQSQHDSSEARLLYENSARGCPGCGSRNLTWFWYATPLPPVERRMFHGFAGWMTACESCNVEIDFFQAMRVYYK